MKKSLAALLSVCSLSVFANPQFDNITRKDVKNVSEEFGTNFAHTVVAAPETNGLWGIEVGVMAGTSRSPEFKKVIDRSGGDGSDFKNIYNGGIIGRVHAPFDLFAEFSYLPEQEFDDVKGKSSSFGLGWNLGGFFNWPVDVAIGMGYGTGDVSFHQASNGATVPEADIELKTKTSLYYVAVSKTFLFFTPYAKVGIAQIKGDLDASAEIFNITGRTSESVDLNGSYLALGANIDVFFLRFGVEASQIHDVSKLAGKLSFAF